MSNASAMTRLNQEIARVRSLPLTLPDIAVRVVDKVKEIIAGNIAAGAGPDGKPWTKTQDGQPALVHAMKSVDVRAVGATVVISLDGIENRHHIGAVKGGVQREIIPSRKLPEAMVQAISEVCNDVLAEHMS